VHHNISSATFATIANRNKPHNNYNLDALNIIGSKVVTAIKAKEPVSLCPLMLL
jgi:hypothetical protein